jgi:hypothetical protein
MLNKVWTKTKQQQYYVEYKTARCNSKTIIKEAKIKSWQEYGNTLNNDHRNLSRQFQKKNINVTRKRGEY